MCVALCVKVGAAVGTRVSVGGGALVAVGVGAAAVVGVGAGGPEVATIFCPQAGRAKARTRAINLDDRVMAQSLNALRAMLSTAGGV